MTDIERSTLLWQEDPASMATAVARHDEIVAQVITANQGRLIKSRGEGDSTFSVFEDATDAIAAAIEFQAAIRAEAWNLSRPIVVRAAINFGEIEDRTGDCYGPEVNLCARLRAAANPGQVLVSGSVVRQLRQTDARRVAEIVPIGKHRLKDLAEIVEVFQVSKAGVPESFGPISSLNAGAGFLPQFGFGFLCRSAELEEVDQLLRKQNLVTIVGPGGVGKTRLAIEAARLFTPWTPDGAQFVDLTGARDAESLPGQIAPSLKLRPEASLSLDALTAELSNKEAVLVLDGCERLLTHIAPLVRRILQSCTRMKILVTSRTTLKLSGEQVFRLRPLDVPQSNADVDTIEDTEAVQFFVNRAAMTRHDFTLTAKNARAIATICTQLDGIPAALEMAAVRVRSLTPQQIAERLGSRYRLLGQGDSQGTLRALFDWSWDSLGINEQRFAWCMTVFEDSFDLDAVEAVSRQFETEVGVTEFTGDFTGVKVDPYMAIDAIDALVERSLLTAEQADASMRYRLTSTFKEYALERWPPPAPLVALEGAHAHYYLSRIFGIDEDATPRDAKNFSRAIQHFLRAGASQAASDLALFMSSHWVSAGLYAEGLRTARECLVICTGEDNKANHAKLLNAIGVFEYYLGEIPDAGEHLSRASALALEFRDEALRSKSLNNLSLLYMAEGRTDEAIASLEEALPYDRAQSDESKLVISLSNLGYLFTVKGDLPRARELLEEALQMTGRVDDRRTAIPCLVNLSDLALEEQNLERSAAYAQRGMTYAEELNDAVGAACCLTNLGEVELRKGNFEDAESLLRRALGRSIDMNASWIMGSILDLLAIVFWRKGRLEPATSALVHRQVASAMPSPSRFAAEVGEIFAVVETEVGSEALARLRHRAEKCGIAGILDELPRR